jgi:hypothetical protein
LTVDIYEHIENIPRKYFYSEKNQEDSNKDQQILCDFKDLKDPDNTPDIAFSTYLTVEFQVVIIPMSSFFNPN